MEILAATNNEHKIGEFKKIFRLNGLNNVDILNPSKIENKNVMPDETGNSYEENAEIKAIAFYKAYEIPCFADDSGLNVEAIHGDPGIKSARYAGDNANDQDNRKKLIEVLKEFDNYDKYNAYFECVICFYDGNYTTFFKGRSYGEIILDERGDKGFGYDPIFIPAGFDKTFAEIDPDTKNIISHRAKAVMNLSEHIKRGLI